MSKTLKSHAEKMAAFIQDGKAPHYAFILDRSTKSKEVFKQLKDGPEEIRARANSPAVEFWGISSFEFVVIWGTWGLSGGLTIQALDLDQLLNVALPTAVERTAAKGGLCTFIPAVDDKLLDQVMSKLAELQPITDSNMAVH